MSSSLFTHPCRLPIADCRLLAALCLLSSVLGSALFADEAALLQSLAAGSAPERDAARQALLSSATPAAIPQLAAQLATPETFDNACLLLEALRLPAADAALRAALERTSGREQAGLLDALARRADAGAEQQALALTSRPEPVRSASLHYLGRLASPAALAALAAEPAAASADATLAAAETLAARKELKQAAALYGRLYRSELPDHLRLAAFTGLVRTDLARTPALLTEGLSHASPLWRGTAARLAAQLPEKSLAKQGPKLLKSLPAEGRLALVSALVAAKRQAGAPLLRAALENEADAPTRLAAAAGLGDLGSASDAPALIALLGHADAALADAARMSLIKLADPKTDARLVRALGQRGLSAEARARLISVATFRKSTQAAPALLPCLADTDPAVRTAAFNALAALCVENTAPALAAAAAAATAPAEIRAAEKALAAMARNHPEAATRAMLDACKTVPPAPPVLFFQPLALASHPAGLAPLATGVEAKDPAVSEEALRTLANVWKTCDAIPCLTGPAASHTNSSLRVVSLRGAIRLLPLVPDPVVYEKVLARVTELASRPEEKALLANLPPRAPRSWLPGVHFLPRRLGAHRSEACAVADFNGDGKPDIAAGPFLYLAPDWKPVQIREVSTTVTEDGKGYADDFCNLVLDVNKDGRPDIVSGGWFNKTSFWFENTGGRPGLWPAHVIDPLGNHETGTLEDIDGDGQALEFLPQTHITVWYERGQGTNGAPTLVRHTVSEKKGKLGAGAGDLNGDGRPDILRPDAWFEAPKDLRNGTWKEHPIALGGTNGTSDHTSNILVLDLNKDGLNDILVSVAHKFGIFWYEQQRGADGAIAWKQHTIDDTWSQPHYLALADIDNDGHKELITGKRFMAHNGSDPDELGKQCVFYYRFTPGPDPVFRKHVITYDEGIGAGLNIVAADIDADGDLDLVTTGKWGGPMLFENRMAEPVSDEARRAAMAVKNGPSEPARGDNLALAARGAKAAADSELDGAKGCSAKLNDGMPASYTTFAQTRWHSALTPPPHWAEVKLARPAAVRRVIARFADPGGYATAFDIQVKRGAEYTTVFTTDKNREAQAVNVTFDPVETDTVRFVFRKNANPAYPNAAQLSELEVYAQ